MVSRPEIDLQRLGQDPGERNEANGGGETHVVVEVAYLIGEVNLAKRAKCTESGEDVDDAWEKAWMVVACVQVSSGMNRMVWEMGAVGLLCVGPTNSFEWIGQESVAFERGVHEIYLTVACHSHCWAFPTLCMLLQGYMQGVRYVDGISGDGLCE